MNSDVIYYLKDGNIIEKGKFKELMKENTEFKKLYDFQVSIESGDSYEKA